MSSRRTATVAAMLNAEREIATTIWLIPGAFARFRERGLCETSFASAPGRYIYSVLSEHYAANDQPLTESALRLRLGDRAGWLDEFCTPKSTLTMRGEDDVWSEFIAQRAQQGSVQTLKRAIVAIEQGEPEAAGALLENAQVLLAETRTDAAQSSRIVLSGTDDIFAPQAPMRWISQGLMIGAGRPTLVVAYGATGKTLALQSLVLCAAAGRPIWERFDVREPLRVVHLDYEQGSRDTFRRYQRLAIGHGIDSCDLEGRLQVASMPPVYLTSPDADDALIRVADSTDLVIIDSLRAATPEVDENASEVRRYLDLLTRLSEKTGAAFVVIHHAGKPNAAGQRDSRTLARGSSAIFDAAGCVLQLDAGKSKGDPKRVSMSKPPSSSEGAALDDFGLVIEDVAIGDERNAGVRVYWHVAERHDGVSADRAKYEADVTRLLTAIRSKPGSSQAQLIAETRMKRQRAADVLDALVDEGRIRRLPGPRSAMCFYVNQ